VKPQRSLSPLSKENLAELGGYADDRALSDYLNCRPEFIRTGVVRELAEAVRQELRVDVDRGLRLADAALAIAHRINHPESLGLANRAKANSLCRGGKLKLAIELFQVAVDHFQAAGATEEVGRTLSSSIQPLMLLGEYDRAIQSAERARQIFLQTDDPLRLARLEINVANIHQRQARFSQALDKYKSAYERLQPHKDQEAMAVALHNMAVCLIILNNFDRALETYRHARMIAAKNNMPLLVAQADYNIAYLFFLRGDYHKAIDGLRAARELYQKNGNEYHSALCDLDQSEIYLELNLSREAAQLSHGAQRQFEKLGLAFEAGRSLVNFGIARHQQHESKAALDLFGKARDIFAQEKNAAWQALIQLYSALVLWETGQGEAAVDSCGAALEFFLAHGLHRRAILCYLLLARVSHARTQFAEAQKHCEAALEKLTAVEAPLLNYHAHIIIGDVHRAVGRRSQSYHSYQRARRSLEALRSSLQGEELKIAFMKNKAEVYERLVRICLQQRRRGAAEKAFQYIEQAKSRSLVELVFGRGNPLSCASSLETETSQHLTRLRQELNWYYRRLEIEQTRPDSISLGQIQCLQAEARAQEDNLMQAIRDLPVGSESEHALEAPCPVPLAEVQAALGDEATLLEYFQVESRLLAAVLTRDECEIIELGDTAEIVSSMRMLEFQLSKLSVKAVKPREGTQSLLAATMRRLRELYRYLIAPLIGKLKGRHLIVAPHGALHYLPFHALADGTDYLIDRFTVSYAPSASIYSICHRQSANSAGPSLLLGVHDNRAPWIRQEILSVSKVLPEPQIRLGKHANDDVLRAVGPSSRFIHIATHSAFRRDNPMFSSVRLGDSYLNIYDFYQLTLPVELLTLSGCGTGLSVVAGGDELLGLVRGLLSTGAQSLLLSLWDVHDRTTARFMTSFYSELRVHGDKGVALRQAMLELRKTHPHPYYWAPFVLVGKIMRSSSG
jgi:CHAT domain-containing protein